MTTDHELRDRCEAERKANLLAELTRNDWGLTPTAKALGVQVSYLQWMIRHYGLDAKYAKHSQPAGRRWESK